MIFIMQNYDSLQYVPFKKGDIIPQEHNGNPLSCCLDEGDTIWGIYKHLVSNEYLIGETSVEVAI